MWKNSNVVMLATNQKSGTIWMNTIGQLIHTHVSGEYKEKYQPQHIYITSDEEIKDGEWCIDIWNVEIIQMDSATKNMLDSGMLHNPHAKIIATTDTSLGLPQPSQQFIQQYIEEYNKGNVITKIEVEYGVTKNNNREFIEFLWITSDNTINIRPIKDSWNREEHAKSLSDLSRDLSKNFNLPFKESFDFTIKWIKENL